MTNHNINHKILNSNSSIIESRFPIFLPTQKITKLSWYEKFIHDKRRLQINSKLDDGIYEVTIFNEILTQTHRNILDILLSKLKEMEIKENKKSFSVYISRYEIFKKLNVSAANYKWLEEKLEEAKNFSCKVKIKTTSINKTFMFGIIDSFIIDNNTGNLKVSFSPTYMELLANNPLLEYKDLVEEVIKLKHPFIERAIRYLFTHKMQTISFNNLFEIISCNLFTKTKKSKIKKELYQKQFYLKKFGISIQGLPNEDYRILYNRPELIKYLSTKNDIKLQKFDSFKVDSVNLEDIKILDL